VPDIADTLVSRKIRRYGWRPSLGRVDLPVANVAGITIKDEVDPRATLAKWVWNQWQLGSCTANATTNLFRYDAYLDGNDSGPLCRLGVYWGERKIEGTIGKGDTGAEGHDAFTVAQAGIPNETAWAYNWSGMQQEQAAPETYFDPATEPSEYRQAPAAYKLTKQVAAVPQTEQAIKAALSNDQLIAFGFTVYPGFESQQVAETGIVPMPKAGRQPLGGHEPLIVGYLEQHENYALCMNSWDGKDSEAAGSVRTPWGLDGQGFFLMPWRYLINRQLVSDLRTIVRAL
jgi:hypothetical protein